MEPLLAEDNRARSVAQGEDAFCRVQRGVGWNQILRLKPTSLPETPLYSELFVAKSQDYYTLVVVVANSSGSCLFDHRVRDFPYVRPPYEFVQR